MNIVRPGDRAKNIQRPDAPIATILLIDVGWLIVRYDGYECTNWITNEDFEQNWKVLES